MNYFYKRAPCLKTHANSKGSSCAIAHGSGKWEAENVFGCSSLRPFKVAYWLNRGCSTITSSY